MAKPWTPNYLPFRTLTNWYDSTDTGTLTLSTGDTVAEWRDKSYYANNLSEVDYADLPTYGTTNLNGLSTVDFDEGEGINLDIINTEINQPLYVLFAGFSNSFSGTSTLFTLENSAGDQLVVRNVTDNVAQIFQRKDGDERVYGMGSGSKTDIPVIYTLSAANENAVFNFNIDADSTGVQILSSTTYDSLQLGVWHISDSNEINSYNGQIGEFIIVQGDIAPNDVKKLEGYTAWKWGMVDYLPSDHPYKAAPPTVTDVEYRNKLYETSIEEGSSRFRRLFLLGYV